MVILANLQKEGIPVSSVEGMPTCLELIGRANVVGSKAYRSGSIEIQDISSQRFCRALKIDSDMIVWDMCAGAGGKTLAMAADGARVHATDPRTNAMKQLKKRAHRAGVIIEDHPPKKADLIVIDAPCSGTGRLHREPALRWRLGEQDALQNLETQARLIEKAGKRLHRGGRIAYSTCSLLEDENNHPIPGDMIDEKWLWPHKNGGDGFYWRIVSI